MQTRNIAVSLVLIFFTACVKKVEPDIVVTYDNNSTIIYSLDRNYTVQFPSANPVNNEESIVKNSEMSMLFKQIKVLILKIKKRDAIIYSLEDKERECQ